MKEKKKNEKDKSEEGIKKDGEKMKEKLNEWKVLNRRCRHEKDLD